MGNTGGTTPLQENPGTPWLQLFELLGSDEDPLDIEMSQRGPDTEDSRAHQYVHDLGRWVADSIVLFDNALEVSLFRQAALLRMLSKHGSCNE